MKIDGIGNLCLGCFEEIGDEHCCPYCNYCENSIQDTDEGLLPGTLVGGHFLIGRMLGQGGFGITYLAYDLELRVKCAVKEYFPQGLVFRNGNVVEVTRRSESQVYQKTVESFCREAQNLAKFSGLPNVVQIHTFFLERGTAYIVMEYVEGISFQQYLENKGGKISCQEALNILKPVGKALSVLHAANLIHRDIKPDNIMITRDGTPKLLDFGAARYETKESTYSSASVLTPGYAPIEQYGSMKMQGSYTDVYAFAATFYRAVSGVVPMTATGRLMEDGLIPLNELDERIPKPISDAVARAMCVLRDDRTQTVDEFLSDLGKWIGEPPKKNFPFLILVLAFILCAAGLLGYKFFISNSNSKLATQTNTPEATATTMPTETAASTPAPHVQPKPFVKNYEQEDKYVMSEKNESAVLLLSQPDNTKSIICSLKNETGISRVIEEKKVDDEMWVQIETVDGKRGWIAASEIPDYKTTEESLKEAEIGDRLTLGRYELDNNKRNGNEPISWWVIDKDEDKLFLLSENVICFRQYREKGGNNRWNRSSLKMWLDYNFLYEAFTETEQAYISEEMITLEDDSQSGTGAGKAIKSKIFLLSAVEAEAYFSNDADRMCYAEGKESQEGTQWWLRSPGLEMNTAVIVEADGAINLNGINVSSADIGIRPAMWVKR